MNRRNDQFIRMLPAVPKTIRNNNSELFRYLDSVQKIKGTKNLKKTAKSQTLYMKKEKKKGVK